MLYLRAFFVTIQPQIHTDMFEYKEITDIIRIFYKTYNELCDAFSVENRNSKEIYI